LWNKPEYYQTIQCADIDGDGRAELIGRAAGGLVVYKYTPGTGWSPLVLAQAPFFRDSQNWDGWNQAFRYATIQCADFFLPGDPGYSGLGHPQAVLLFRDSDGIHGWQYTPGSGWNEFTDFTDDIVRDSSQEFFDAPHYETIQYADIDGDGRDELLIRLRDGLRSWKHTPGSGWRELPVPRLGPAGDPIDPIFPDWWGWNQSQYYRTVQTARVKGSATNPNNPPGPGGKPVAALIGRSGTCIETRRVVPTDLDAAWARTSAPWPEFTGDKLDAYNYLTQYFGLLGGGLRNHYDNMSETDFNHWTGTLYTPAPGRYDQSPRPAPSLAADAFPAPIGAVNWEQDWADVTWQLYWEVQYVEKVHEWFGTHIQDVIQATFPSNNTILDAVNNYINLPSDDPTSMALNILSLLFNAAWAVLGAVTPEGAIAKFAVQIAGAVAGCISTAFEAGADFTPGDGSTLAAYADLKLKLLTNFNNALKGNGRTQLAITGGGVDSFSGQYVDGDWGLLWAIGKQIESTAWTWPSTEQANLVLAAQRQYAKDVWGPLCIAKGWGVTRNESTPIGYPTEYLYTSDHQYRLYVSHYRDFPAVTTLQKLFGPPAGDLFPLGVPLADVFEGKNGWPKLPGANSSGVGAPPPPKQPTFGADLQLSKLVLTRAPATSQIAGAVGDVVATFTLSNHGLGGASNVTITAAQLRNQVAIDGVPSQYVYLAGHQSRQMTVRFPGSIGAKGARAVLRLSGQYLGGTFGASQRVQLP
jgi:hypothetical protein